MKKGAMGSGSIMHMQAYLNKNSVTYNVVFPFRYYGCLTDLHKMILEILAVNQLFYNDETYREMMSQSIIIPQKDISQDL